MKKAILAILLIFCMAAFSEAAEIYVLVKENAKEFSVGGTNYIISVADGGVTPPITGKFTVRYNGTNLLSAGNVKYAMPVNIVSNNPLYVNNIGFHGTLILEKTPKGFNIVNKVDLEEYLKGVLKSEMSPNWHIEALKAQAVLARTYTVSGKKHGKYDICANSHCQVYGGKASEYASLVQAVEATSGEVLYYNGEIAKACYYGDSGGCGASANSVWGKDFPYLYSRPDPVPSSNPVSNWKVDITLSEISSKLASAGVNVGHVNSLRIVEKDESGRVRQIEVTGSSGTKIITGIKFRFAIGAAQIKSTLFDFTPITANPAPSIPPKMPFSQPPQNNCIQGDTDEKNYPVIEDNSAMPSDSEEKLYWFTKKKIFTLDELMSMIGKVNDYPKFIAEGEARMSGRKIPVPQKPKYEENAGNGIVFNNNYYVKSKPNYHGGSYTRSSVVTVYGRGYGHGVGMPQWTAKAMAENGWNYKQILDYYFPGTTIERENFKCK